MKNIHEKYLIKESNSFFNDTIKQIKMLVDINNHTEAIALGCEYVGLDMEAKKARRIAYEIERDGQLSTSNKRERDKLYNFMMAHAKDELSPNEYKEFYKAF